MDSPLIETLFNIKNIEKILINKNTIIIRQQKNNRFTN